MYVHLKLENSKLFSSGISTCSTNTLLFLAFNSICQSIEFETIQPVRIIQPIRLNRNAAPRSDEPVRRSYALVQHWRRTHEQHE